MQYISHILYQKSAGQCVFLSINICMIWIDLCRWLPSFFTHQKGKIWLPVSTSTWAQNGSSHRSPLHRNAAEAPRIDISTRGLLNQSWFLSLEMNPTKSFIWGDYTRYCTRTNPNCSSNLEPTITKTISHQTEAHLPHQNFTVELHVTDATFQLPIRQKLRDAFGSRNFQSNKKTRKVYW